MKKHTVELVQWAIIAVAVVVALGAIAWDIYLKLATIDAIRGIGK